MTKIFLQHSKKVINQYFISKCFFLFSFFLTFFNSKVTLQRYIDYNLSNPTWTGRECLFLNRRSINRITNRKKHENQCNIGSRITKKLDFTIF